MSQTRVVPEMETLLEYQKPKELTESEILKSNKRKRLVLPQLESKPNMEDVLDIIFPPVTFEQDHKQYIQYVQTQNSSREDVDNLQKIFEQRLDARQARDKGLCPIKEDLHSQCFDEIIRQVLIDQPERGLLLLRVRDDLKQTVQAYKDLYESSTKFGLKKQLDSENENNYEDKIKDLEQERHNLRERRQELIEKQENIQKRIKDRREELNKQRRDQLEYLNYQGSNLESMKKMAQQN